MSPGRIVALVLAVALAAAALLRRKRLGGEKFTAALVAAGVLAVYGSGVLQHVDIQKGIEDLANALGKWTYVLVGLLAFAETGAFIGLVAPGEFTVILGGVIAGQGTINIFVLIGIVWACTLTGDTLSFFLGRRLGRSFLEKHGPKFRLTHERLAVVEQHFQRRGGATVLVGRFIGFVRPIAPFLAGASRLPYRRFLPYSIVGTGLWGPGFCLLGYIFWQSFDQVTKYAGRATLIFGVIVFTVVGIVWLRRKLRNPEERAKLVAWFERQAERPLIRPFAKVVRPVWRHVMRPVIMVAAPRVRFLIERLTPGALGLEFTTALSVTGVGLYAFIAYAVTFSDDPTLLTPADSSLLKLADRTHTDMLEDIIKVYTDLGSLPVVGAFTAISVVMLAMRHRPVEIAVLVLGLVAIIITVHLTKAAIDRPRPPDPLTNTVGSSYPSAHAAYSTAYVAMAVIASRVLRGLASRGTLVLLAILGSASIGMSRIYLRAHYWSDVAGGWGLGAGIFGLFAMVAMIVVYMRNTSPARAERV
jgi:membrane protein DedA with SNARE-associated domain